MEETNLLIGLLTNLRYYRLIHWAIHNFIILKIYLGNSYPIKGTSPEYSELSVLLPVSSSYCLYLEKLLISGS